MFSFSVILLLCIKRYMQLYRVIQTHVFVFVYVRACVCGCASQILSLSPSLPVLLSLFLFIMIIGNIFQHIHRAQ